MNNPFRFIPYRRRAGVYFNVPGDCTYSATEDQGHSDEKFRRAVVAARTEFLRVWNSGETQATPTDKVQAKERS